jgi:hypothetical protein
MIPKASSSNSLLAIIQKNGLYQDLLTSVRAKDYLQNSKKMQD